MEKENSKVQLVRDIKALVNNFNTNQSPGEIGNTVYFILNLVTELNKIEPNYMDEIHSLELVIKKEIKEMTDLSVELMKYNVDLKTHPEMKTAKERVIQQTRYSIPQLIR